MGLCYINKKITLYSNAYFFSKEASRDRVQISRSSGCKIVITVALINNIFLKCIE